MKANEAPEKIFLHPDIGGREFIRPWLKRRVNQESVEYTRTDAFIERVSDWLFDNLQTVRDVTIPSAHHVESIPALGIITLSEFVEKFKKEIKFLFD